MNAARSTPLPPRQAGEPITADRYAEYERRKRALIESGGPILPAMYDVEIRRIAKDCGV